MIPELRKETILQIIRDNDISFITDIAEKLYISHSTARRDIALLEKEGSVVTMRGGGVRKREERFDEPVVRKQYIHEKEKNRIAEYAVTLVRDGDVIYIDSGTTTVSMLKYLEGRRVTIVSSSTTMLKYLPMRNAKCILLGGEVSMDLESIMGAQTDKMISDMHFDKAFIGGSGFTYDGPFYTFDDREARKKDLVRQHSDETYVLMDCSKENQFAFAKVFDLSEATLITEKIAEQMLKEEKA